MRVDYSTIILQLLYCMVTVVLLLLRPIKRVVRINIAKILVQQITLYLVTPLSLLSSASENSILLAINLLMNLE